MKRKTAIMVLELLGSFLILLTMAKGVMATNVTLNPDNCYDAFDNSSQQVTVCASPIPNINVTCAPNLTVVWSSNISFEDRYYVCKDSKINCENQLGIVSDNYNTCKGSMVGLDSAKSNATYYEGQYNNCQTEKSAGISKAENDKTQWAMIAGGIGLAGGYFLFKKKEPEEAKDVGALPRVM